MLIRVDDLERIQSGVVDTAFRRWTGVPDEEHEEPAHQVAITDALAENAEAKLGDGDAVVQCHL